MRGAGSGGGLDTILVPDQSPSYTLSPDYDVPRDPDVQISAGYGVSWYIIGNIKFPSASAMIDYRGAIFVILCDFCIMGPYIRTRTGGELVRDKDILQNPKG